MIKLSDYVINFLVQKGITDIFLVSGGGVMYLLDSIGRNKKIRYICNHHEQASATCAESWARIKNHISACLVTTGPGSTNAVTGVAAAWVDSIPIIVISGQVKKEIIADYSKLRQLAPQEINIIDIVNPITKYAKTIMEPETIKYELEKAFYEAQTGRPGPVWINIPLDVQGSMIDERKLRSIQPSRTDNNKIQLRKAVNKTLEMFKNSKRPIIICGNGIRLSSGIDLFFKLISKLNIPVINHINSIDIMPFNHSLCMGIYGPNGQRRANFVLQNSDLVLAIGASLNVASTGFNFKDFAPKAKKIMVNIDKGEVTKNTLSLDLPISVDAKDFLKELLFQIKKERFECSSVWLKACYNWKKRYPNILPEFFTDKNHVNSYVFMDKLSDLLTSQDVLVTGIGLDVVSFYQAFKVKKGQRAFVNKNFGQMGWCLPASIGACFARDKKRTILVTGDGSIQFNIHELAVIKYHRLPVKIFIFSNKGYKCIRDTQNSLFAGRLVGADEDSGLTNPVFKKLAQAYNLKYGYISNNDDLETKITQALKTGGPVLYEVNIAYNQERIPRSKTVRKKDGTLVSSTLGNMYPFLPEKEVWENMHLFDE